MNRLFKQTYLRDLKFKKKFYLQQIRRYTEYLIEVNEQIRLYSNKK